MLLSSGLVLCILAFLLVPKNFSDLIFVQVIYRHGERTPLGSYPNDPYQAGIWPNGFGQLTTRGCQEQYELGEYLRSRYGHFLSADYSPSEIYVRSTDADSTLASAACNLAGLFRPSLEKEKWIEQVNWRPVPIHTVPRDQDYLLITGRACPVLQLLRQLEEQTENINALYGNLLAYLATATGYQRFNMSNMETLADLLEGMQKAGFALPEWSAMQWFDPVTGQMTPVMDIVLKLNTLYRVHQIDTVEKATYEGGLFIATVSNYMDEKISGTLKTPTKMAMYSVHDGMLLAYMYGMGIGNGKVPPTTSCLMIELHEDGGKYFVNTYFKNSTEHEAYFLVPPNCCDTGCSLEEYEAIADDASFFTMDQRNEECDI